LATSQTKDKDIDVKQISRRKAGFLRYGAQASLPANFSMTQIIR
jgi:hypothetical protein